MAKGYLSLVLHAHLPYVRHPEYGSFLEEDWLFEAITETYVPLLRAFRRLTNDGVDFRLTVSLSPPLVSMLQDPLLQERYMKHLEGLIELTGREMDRCRDDARLKGLAETYHRMFSETRTVFAEEYGLDLVRAFREFQDLGKLELTTCGATHGYLPLMQEHPAAVRAQVRLAAEHHRATIGRDPRGIWLPECGYFPGVDEYLAEQGIRFTFIDTHGMLHAAPRPKYGNYAPVVTRSGVAVFGRDLESSKQVWSAKEGYPGDALYRDFYSDYSYDLDYDYVRPYLGGDGSRKMLGLKYWRITGSTDAKEFYDPEAARARAYEHAGNFLFNRERQIEHLHGVMGREPIIVAPYDAELFGHWWFEGPVWLEELLRRIDDADGPVRTATPSDYLDECDSIQRSTPFHSSWGYMGYSEVWLNNTNDYVYRHLHRAASRMTELAKDHPHAEGLRERALNQAARELLLAQASDWAFIMKTGAMAEYAHKRTRDHVARFSRLYAEIRSNAIDEKRLSETEWRDRIFPELDYRIYADDSRPAPAAVGLEP
ncbi:MAG: 1,4-alpha-glucan branching protein domain-containing protein [Candidatus Eisenbacteria bacterium]